MDTDYSTETDLSVWYQCATYSMIPIRSGKNEFIIVYD